MRLGALDDVEHAPGAPWRPPATITRWTSCSATTRSSSSGVPSTGAVVVPRPRVQGDPPHEGGLDVGAGQQLGADRSATAASPTSRQRSGAVAARAIARAATRQAISRTVSPSQVTAMRCALMGVRSRALSSRKATTRGERGGMEHRGRLVEGALAQEQLVTPVQPRRRVDDDDQRKERERRPPRAEDAEDAVGQPDDEQAREEVGAPPARGGRRGRGCEPPRARDSRPAPSRRPWRPPDGAAARLAGYGGDLR